nr:hypothetical protein [Candidatus Gracilibacteria bacterium]
MQGAKNKETINKKAVTMVELIVVMTIIVLLPMIGFYFFTSNMVDSRDAYRISQISALNDSIRYFKTNHELPLPDNYVEVRVNGITVAYQGYIGESVLGALDYKGKLDTTQDPKDQKYYTYYITKNKKYFQLMSYLEKSNNKVAKLIDGVMAEGTRYKDRIPYTLGDKLGVVIDKTTNNPIQEVPNVTSIGYINFTGTLVGTYNLIINNELEFSSIDNITVGNKIIELTKSEQTALYGTGTVQVCGGQIYDTNAESTATSESPSYNWGWSDTPGICTWNCKPGYTWDGTMCGVACSVPVTDVHKTRTYDVYPQDIINHGLTELRTGLNLFGTSYSSGTLTSTFTYKCNNGTITKLDSINGVGTCGTNYTFNNVWTTSPAPQCIPNTQIALCGGALPANSIDTSVTGSRVQTWSGTGWEPVNSWVWNYNNIPGTCTFICSNNYFWNGTLCEHMPENGVCGTSNGGYFTSAPASGLCSIGNPSAVSGTGPWTRTCSGLYGGSSVNCGSHILYTYSYPTYGQRVILFLFWYDCYIDGRAMYSPDALAAYYCTNIKGQSYYSRVSTTTDYGYGCRIKDIAGFDGNGTDMDSSLVLQEVKCYK